MRTTLILNDELMQAAKKRAAERQTSLSTLVNEALRDALKSPVISKNQPPFQMPTYLPENAGKTDTSPDQIHDLLVAEDSEPYGS